MKSMTVIEAGPNRLSGLFAMRESNYWKAVEMRDSEYDGTFVFGVRSTGIYCRPSCPAKRAQRHQVVFFSLPDAAEVAGFRACHRCHPEAATFRNPQLDVVQRVCRWIESHLEDTLTLQAMSKEIGMSSFHLQRTFKRFMGITPRQYADAFRLRHFKTTLKNGQSVTSALYESGYGSNSRLYERASSQLGMTPATYKKGGKGIQISYSIGHSSLGRVLIGATTRGICSIRFGDSAERLKSELQKEYPEAKITKGSRELREWTTLILKYLKGWQKELNLPLDIRATTFQWRVWKALQSIPYGSTLSYSKVAKSIGRPSAVRAVARACATNPVALVIPCHRVVREDGNLGGYRWGLHRKEALLKQEASK